MRSIEWWGCDASHILVDPNSTSDGPEKIHEEPLPKALFALGTKGFLSFQIG